MLATSSSSTSDSCDSRGPAIGIDLGTTYSCVAVCQNGEVVIIKNEIGENTTPSHVAFPNLGLNQTSTSCGGPSTIVVGDTAKQSAAVNPKNAIYDVKRLIGRRFDDPVVQNDMKRWPFEVVNEENNPRLRVNNKLYYPEQISAKVLAYLKKQAEIRLDCPVTDAVITVPAYFNDGQRQATKDAGTIAGLNVLRIINEPTAAAIAYNHQLQQQMIGTNVLKKKTVLIFDLGGGTFDLALLTMEGGIIQVLAVDGDAHLGGQDFDNAMVDYCIQEFQKKHNIDLSKCRPEAESKTTEIFNVSKRLRRIKNECEMKKINLSASSITNINIEVIIDDLDLSIRIKRDTFVSINQSKFDKCMALVDRILGAANMSKDEIDDVVLVGGSSRIPKIQEMIQNYFGKEPCRSIKQDEAVAYGAAVQASQMRRSMSKSKSSTNNDDEETFNDPQPDFGSGFTEVVFSDVIPHSIGVQIHVSNSEVNDFDPILLKNTRVPCHGENTYYTGYDGQREALISIYEGQGASVAENYLLGEFVIDNLPPDSPKGEKVVVHMVINEEGLLKVTAECPANQSVSNITVTARNGRLNREEVVQLRFEEISLEDASYISVLETFEQD